MSIYVYKIVKIAIDLYVFKLEKLAQSRLFGVILSIICMLKYCRYCYQSEVQDYLIEYTQLNGSKPSKQMVNKPALILDNFFAVNKQSTTNNTNNVLGNQNSLLGTSNSTLVPVGVTGIVQNNTPTSGSFVGTPDTSDNMVVKGEINQMDTTTFIDNAEMARRDESMVAHIDPRWFQINDSQQTEQNIKDFLCKPIVLLNGNFTIADTLISISSREMPYSALTATLWMEKLRGYFGIRMDMRFRLVVNANRFQQGRYIMGWVPLGGMGPSGTNTKSVEYRKSHTATLVQRTTIPHTELDIASTTSCELLVPFASIHTFYPLNALNISGGSFNSTLGFVCLYPYSPLVAPTGDTTAGFTLYCSFENVTLFGAASPQSLSAEREISHKSNGPISGVATAFSRGFSEISAIPLLSSYAKSAAWITDRIAKAAKIFGYAKPTAGDSIGKIMILNNPGHSNIDGDSDVRTLSYLAKPSTIALDGMSGTNLDEMDFSYVSRKFAWFKTVSWTPGTTGTITNINIEPTFYNTVGGARHYTPVGFVASYFGLWRGSMKIRLKFVKTEFHSGRLMIAFFPYDDITNFSSQPEYVNRHIIDIREYNEFTFEVPYISRYAWTNTGSRIGILSIRIVDSLVAPASVSSTVNILCEVAGGDDLQFAVPSFIMNAPGEFVPQSGLSDPNKISVNIGNTTTMGDPVAASAYTVGDQVTSFRALLKRFHPLIPNTKVVGNTARPNSLLVEIVPDLIPIVPLAAFTDSVQCDVLGAVASCYTFWGGGVRIKDVVDVALAPTPNVSNNSSVISSLITPALGATSTSIYRNMSLATQGPEHNSHQVLQNTWLNNTLNLEVPQYTKGLKRCIPDAWYSHLTVPDGDKTAYRNNLTQGTIRIGLPASMGTVVPIANYDLHNFYRALSDDGEFSLFCSIPPMYDITNTNSNNMY